MSRGTGNEHKAELDPELFGLPNSEVEVGFYSKVYHFVLRPTVGELSYLLSHAPCAGATAWLRAQPRLWEPLWIVRRFWSSGRREPLSTRSDLTSRSTHIHV